MPQNIEKNEPKDKKRKSGGTGSAPANTDDPGAPGGGAPGSDSIPSFHRGGKVRKTGLARLKKGERVLTRKQQRKSGRSGKSRG